MEAIPYTPDLKRLWDDFVSTSRNATFQHRRDYMEYHSDRFTDRSLIVTTEGGRTVALLPAATNASGTLASHGGLTFGGLLLPGSDTDATASLEAMQTVCGHFARQGFTSLVYKAIPHIHHRRPAQEDIYALFRMGARWCQCNISSAIDLSDPLAPSRTQRYHANHAQKEGIVIERSADFGAYWQLLSRLLSDRYNTSPVHNLDEIGLLVSRFPDNIQLWTARDAAGQLLAGVVMYVDAPVAHAQYIAASDEGKRRWALPLLFRQITAHYAGDTRLRWLDLGTSNEDGGRYLNEGLLNQKAQLGGRGVAYNIYEIPL